MWRANLSYPQIFDCMGSWCSNPPVVQGSTVHLFDNVNMNIAIKMSKSPVSSILMLRDKKKTTSHNWQILKHLF